MYFGLKNALSGAIKLKQSECHGLRKLVKQDDKYEGCSICNVYCTTE